MSYDTLTFLAGLFGGGHVADAMPQALPDQQSQPSHKPTAGGGAPRAQPQDVDADAGEWLEVIDADGRRCMVRSDVAECEVVDPQPCAVGGCLERWQDLADGWHCERCEPRTRATRLREHARRLRARHERTSPRIAPRRAQTGRRDQ